jgi:hypothetical protein
MDKEGRCKGSEDFQCPPSGRERMANNFQTPCIIYKTHQTRCESYIRMESGWCSGG